MNDSSVKIWKWLVIVLVIINIALLATIWMKPRFGGPHEHTPPLNGGPREMIIHELNFNKQQIKQFDVLVSEHRNSIKELREQGKDLRTNLFDLLKTDVIDSVKVKEATSAIGANQIAIESSTFSHFEKVRKICDEGQKKKFDEIIQTITHMMAGPQGPPPPMGPPR